LEQKPKEVRFITSFGFCETTEEMDAVARQIEIQKKGLGIS
jgi:hypothetical protein